MTNERRPSRGRPKKYVEEVSRVDVRIPPDVRKRAKIAATERDLGFGEWVALAIVEKLERDAAAKDENTPSV